MKFLHKAKDGGPKSTVTGYWLVEFKKLFSIALLKFEDGSRDAYHNHAFDSLNWVITGEVREQLLDTVVKIHKPSWFPVLTRRSTFHKVISKGTTWVFTLRGPWNSTWKEYDPMTRKEVVLTHGRKVVDEY